MVSSFAQIYEQDNDEMLGKYLQTLPQFSLPRCLPCLFYTPLHALYCCYRNHKSAAWNTMGADWGSVSYRFGVDFWISRTLWAVSFFVNENPFEFSVSTPFCAGGFRVGKERQYFENIGIRPEQVLTIIKNPERTFFSTTYRGGARSPIYDRSRNCTKK